MDILDILIVLILIIVVLNVFVWGLIFNSINDTTYDEENEKIGH